DSDACFEEMSGRQFVRVMARLCGYGRREAERRAEEALEIVGMSHASRRLADSPAGLADMGDIAAAADRPLRGYSKGMRQRIKLAQALVHDPELLLLDEPLSGIDPVGRQDFVRLFHTLAARGKCLLVSSHE